ncbi:MAG: CDGSH iron-sulfur domain-containing protein [Lachnospiraceae bacterium]|nr:CDGSH iron-sulfur domain-containing protein [Lachnospiraceae bacterium]
MYETRNRVVLCRCGKSRNKPFCDAAHVLVRYLDK